MSKCNQDDCHEDVRMDMDCPCEPFLQGSMDVIIEEQLEDGSPNQHKNTRYVKICGSSEECRVYPILIDESTGLGTLHLEDVSSVQSVLVLVDENGQQMMNGDEYDIAYYLNGEQMEEDYAKVVMSSQGREHHDIRMVLRRRENVCLKVIKHLRDEFMESVEFEKDMCFILHLCGVGIEETIVLNAQNDFQVCIEHLCPGHYSLCEDDVCGYCTYYQFDGGEETTCSDIVLTSGTHELEVINQRLSQNVLTIEKYIRDDRGELIKPQDDECFEIRIISDTFDATYTLTCENDFALELSDLEPGFYDVSETSGNYQVSYLVNHQSERDYAHVEVRKCEASSVMIINTPVCDTCASPLRICKFMRRCDGSFVRPDDDMCFKVMLCGCGFYQTFNLNACNNFCVDIDNICCGEYEIREIENECYKTSYIVNDGEERTCAFICLHENECNMIQIINEERNQGSVNVCKYLRNQCGDLVKPMKGDRFVVTLRSFFFRETFILDEHNDWCMCFDHLREGSYEVRERSIDGYDTTYIVNGCKEKKRARFIVDSDGTNEIRIVNTPSKADCGNLKICKYIELQNGDLVKPSANESFEVCVKGDCLDEIYTLHSHNNWCVVLEGLSRGDYIISEVCANGYDVSYLVNGCKMENANVCMINCDQEVAIVNSRQRGGNLQIEAWIRDCDDELMKPCGNASFEVYVEHRDETRCYTLDQRNRWCILLDDLKPGKYRIIQKDSYGYEVTYEINGEEMVHGSVLLDGEDQYVNIINSISNCQGMVTITKSMTDECGNHVKPCHDDEFSFVLRAAGFKKRFTLDDSNDFCVYFDDLREGSYHLEEEDCGYDATFIVNGCEQPKGQFVLGREDLHIEVINQARELPEVCIQKRIRKQGHLCIPDPCECYEFVIAGKGLHEVYTLDVSNDFTICLSGLCVQHYEIKELHVEGLVSYMIDDCLQADGYFTFADKDMNITIINEDGCDDRVRICKVVEENNQQYKPYRWESFDIQIEGRNYKERFNLNCDNDWCIDIDHLTAGSYEVKEVGDYENSFRINGEYSHSGCFFVGGGDCDITIINHICCTGTLHVAAYDVCDGERIMPEYGEYSFTLACDEWCESYTLSCENDWSLCFEELPAMEYTLTSCDRQACFEIDDTSANSVCFQLDCETKYASLLIMPVVPKHCVTINKKLRDACGTISAPSHEEYAVEIQSDAGIETVYLNDKNHYCVQCMLPQGSVTIQECGGSEVLYQFNHGPLHKNGTFSICKDSTITIFNPVVKGSMVCIKASAKTCQGDEFAFQKNDEFEVQLKGEEICETVLINRKNHWCACFEEIPQGSYQLSSTLQGYERVNFLHNDSQQDTIEVAGEDIDVQAIFYAPCEQGSLEILKYKKDSNCGCFVRPCQNESYDIRVWSDDMNEVITLDRSNSWRKRLSHLPSGEYHVEEIAGVDDVSYIVNGGKESDSATLMIDGDASYVKIINTKRKEYVGSIEICKYMKDGSNIHKPDSNSAYNIMLKGPNGEQMFHLHEANDFCVSANGLASGTYEIYEEGQDDVRYIVNNGCEMDRGIVHVMQNHNRVQVLNQPKIHGSMLISKFVKGSDGKLHVPMGEETYRVHVSKANFNKVITLSKENNFKELLDDLDDGWYVVDELDHDDVTYRINGGSEVDHGVVQVRGDEQDVWLINPQHTSGGAITVTKYMRQGQSYRKPQDQDVFQFHISRPGFNHVYTLNKENHWTQVIEQLDNGSYVIQEVGNAYDVSYVINGGSETNFGIVDVQGNENTVFMINMTTSTSGSIKITKYLRDENNQLISPIGNYVARVHVSRPGYNQIFDLTSANKWTIMIPNLADGQYVIDEVDTTDSVSYIINGGSEVNRAIVSVQGNANVVQMINAGTTSGSITITKYIRNSQGDLVLPTGDYEASVHVSRAGFNQTYDLTSANNWTVKIQGLEDGQYVLNEVSGSGYATYIINGGSEVNRAIVRVQGNANDVQMINPETKTTTLHLQKYMREGNGSLIAPAPGEEFQIQLSSPSGNQTYVLNGQNEFHTVIDTIQPGLYTIEEIANEQYLTMYRINGSADMSEAVIEIVEGSANTVDIINELKIDTNVVEVYKYIQDANGAFLKPNRNETFSVRIFNDLFDKTYPLNEFNRWHMMTQDLPSGNYQLEEVSNSGYQVQYLVNAGSTSDTAQFSVLPGSNNIIEIVNRKNIEQDAVLELTKRIRDQNNVLVMPSSDQAFTVRVYNDQGYSERVILNAQNGFTMRLSRFNRGVYYLEEIDNIQYDVTYRINGGSETSSSQIVLDSADVQRVMIINTRTAMFYNVHQDQNLKIILE